MVAESWSVQAIPCQNSYSRTALDKLMPWLAASTLATSNTLHKAPDLTMSIQILPQQPTCTVAP